MQNNILDYEMEKKVEKEIWSSNDVKNLTVIDFGIGDVSTKKLIYLGAKIIAVDNNMEKLKDYNNLGIPLIKCDIVNPHLIIKFLILLFFTLSSTKLILLCMKKLSIKNKYINKMNEFLKYAKKKGMKWSDLIVIVGE